MLGTWRCKINVDIWEFVQAWGFFGVGFVFVFGVGFFLEALKVKITDARLCMSSNLTDEILTPLNFTSFAGSGASSSVCFVRTILGTAKRDG